jgi:hypothetical protein
MSFLKSEGPKRRALPLQSRFFGLTPHLLDCAGPTEKSRYLFNRSPVSQAIAQVEQVHFGPRLAVVYVLNRFIHCGPYSSRCQLLANAAIAASRVWTASYRFAAKWEIAGWLVVVSLIGCVLTGIFLWSVR